MKWEDDSSFEWFVGISRCSSLDSNFSGSNYSGLRNGAWRVWRGNLNVKYGCKIFSGLRRTAVATEYRCESLDCTLTVWVSVYLDVLCSLQFVTILSSPTMWFWNTYCRILIKLMFYVAYGPLRSNEQSCPYFGRVATLPPTAHSAITYIHSPAVVLFSSTITGSDKHIMLSDVRQRRLWGYGTMARKEEASSTVISLHGLSGSTRMNFEIKVSWDSTPCRAVAADVSVSHNNCPVETVKCVKSLECVASRLEATRISLSYSMIGDHELMIHYEE